MKVILTIVELGERQTDSEREWFETDSIWILDLDLELTIFRFSLSNFSFDVLF